MALIDRKIPILTGVNDVPSITGGTTHPNASLLCKNYNDLIDNELTAINENIPTTTTDLTEGTNLYYTDARFDTRLGTKTTDDLTEGTTNKYFAEALARLAISVTGNGSYDNVTGVININNATISVDHTSLTGTVGNVDTYTLWEDLAETLTVGTFTVTNGVDGSDGQSIVATTVTDNLNGTHTVEFFTDLAKTQKVGEVILNEGVDGTNGTNGTNGTDGASVDHISLTNTVGKVKTYTAWGDVGETINMGTFNVTDGNDGTNGTNGTNGTSPTVTVLTQSAYTALGTYDSNTFYVING